MAKMGIAAALALLMLLGLVFPAHAGADDGKHRAGDKISFVISATDPDNNRLTYSASLPAGATLDPTTGVFSWTPTHDQTGIWVIRFTVSDGELTDSEDVTITVYDKNDVNQDLAVNILDLILVGQHFGESGAPGWINEDIDNSGAVDVLDLIQVAQGEWRNYNTRH